MKDVIDQEIERLQKLINRHRGIGIYQNHCVKWSYFIQAYEELKCLTPKTN